ncbi:MAG: FMN-binding protein [Spirochaetales bacterium]|nr:FMN-binding protein [Spirochaetales bacterium]
MKQENKPNKANWDFKQILLVGSKLFVIAAISATLLSLIYAVTEPAKQENILAEEKETLSVLIASGDIGPKEAVNSMQFKQVISRWIVREAGNPVAVVLQLAGNGYGGPLSLMAGYKLDGELINAKLMVNTETPGLGKKAETDAYMNKFRGKGGTGSGYPLPVNKEMLAEQQQGSSAGSTTVFQVKRPANFAEWLFGKPKGNVDTVTGATITFTAVSGALEAGSDYVKQTWGGAE